MVIGNKVLIKQQKTTVKPPYDPKPYVVTEVVGTQITATRAGKETRRNKAKVKVVKVRPAHLQDVTREGIYQEYSDSEDDVDLQLESSVPVQEEQVQDEQVQRQEPGLETEAEGGPAYWDNKLSEGNLDKSYETAAKIWAGYSVK